MGAGVDPDGKRIIKESTWLKMHQEPKVALDVVLGSRTAYTQGGFNHYRNYENPNVMEAKHADRLGWYGWQGYGGAVMQWHPTLKIAFVYAQTTVRWYEPIN